MRAFFLILLSSHVFAKISFDYSMYDDQKEQKCQHEKCYTLKEIVRNIKKDNYDMRDKLETLVQARHNIKVKLGRIIPSFRMSMGVSAGLMDFTAVPSLLGFLFPSNWFNWKESKLFYLAQRQSYKTLLANQIVSGVELYFILHKEFVETDIYSHYYDLIENLEKFFSSEMKKENSSISLSDIKRLEAFKSSSTITSILLQNDFKDTFPLIANLMAMPIDSRWDLASIDLHKLPKLDTFEKMDANAYYEKVINLAPEIKTIEYLLLAMNYTKKARKFSFLTPQAGVDDGFGFGYFSQLKVIRSKKRQLEVKKEKSASLLKVAIHALLLNHNAAIDTYNESIKGRKSAQFLLDSMFKEYENTKKIDMDELIEVVRSALSFDLTRNFSQHYFFANKNKINRMFLEGEHFSHLDKLIPKKKKLDALSSWRKIREDKKIERDIKRKKLILPKD